MSTGRTDDSDSVSLAGAGPAPVAKAYPYLPPRIDIEYFQADVPAVQAGPPPAAQRPRDWYQSTRAIHRRTAIETPEVLGE
jgi:hypothetical protein